MYRELPLPSRNLICSKTLLSISSSGVKLEHSSGRSCFPNARDRASLRLVFSCIQIFLSGRRPLAYFEQISHGELEDSRHKMYAPQVGIDDRGVASTIDGT
jgi:hypothetical protein